MKLLLFIIFLTPLFYTIFSFLTSIDMIADLYITSGTSIFIMLFITLIFSIKKLKKYRKMAGLFTFFYTVLHFINFLILDNGLSYSMIYKAFKSTSYLIFGTFAFIIFIFLAITSNKKLFRKYKNWHIFIYISVILGILHYLYIQKIIVLNDYLFMLPFALILIVKLYRLIKHYYIKI